MKLKDKLIDNIVDPYSKTIFTTSIGKVIDFNICKNTADIYVENLKGNSATFSNVPIQNIGEGVQLSPLEKGDKVYIQFNNDSVFQPKITGMVDESYKCLSKKRRNHIRKGCLLSNIKRDSREITKKMSETWLDYNNKDKLKYKDFMDKNPIDSVVEKIEKKGFFGGKEVGVYHPKKSSIVKLRDDSSIDIFTATNVGLRINAENKTIEIFGDFSAKSENWSVISNNINICAEDKIILSGSEIVIDTKKIKINGVDKNV
ncbi:hypothetical protein IR152_01030 [Clostridioides sp. ES-S-0108-01]|uniref:hypothetical protein n=1 Tax=Clostridioides sp. ES-S-0108-01 TaxID=2770773 RepID=UPI001D0C213D|nr:hypothetical protein [Clostridioides sp. ES-S-0108-01]UDN49959.1 hypothetical protein JJC16_11310 [Clostridioides sp. ES-S-0107-01]